jgi:hypothetical protein
MSGVTVNLKDNGALCLVRDFVYVSSSLWSLFVVKLLFVATARNNNQACSSLALIATLLKGGFLLQTFGLPPSVDDVNEDILERPERR